ncbi:MAG: hypothetical protein ACTSVO_01495 [Candidatus Heimdallarchaeaceae archaeon]
MVYTIYNGVLTGGWLVFCLVLFSILTVASIIWFVLYIEMSQRRNWKLTLLIGSLTSLIIAFEIQIILLQIGIII